MQSSHHLAELTQKTLTHFWGYQDFRDSQQDIIHAVIAGKDTIALLPTGGGKSLCYQLPALVLEGTCLVISPLLALMKDQVQQLKLRGIEAEYLSSELDELLPGSCPPKLFAGKPTITNWSLYVSYNFCKPSY